MGRYRQSIAVLTAVLTLSAGSAQAQAQLPPSTDPSRVLQQFKQAPALPAVEKAAPKAEGGPVTPPPQGAEKLTFTLKRVYIRGMTVYTSDDVLPLYKDMKGKTVSLADIYALADKLTVKYRNDGYILSQVVVPPQSIEDGTVHLQAVEGFIDNVTVQGKTRGDENRLLRFTDKIRAERPLQAKTLEHYILLLNDLAGLTVKSVLAPSPKTPGAADLILQVTEKRYDASLSADNRGTRFTGPMQMNAGVGINNAFGLFEGINVQLVTAPEGWPQAETKYGAVMWSQPLGHEGTRLALGGSISATHPGFTLTPFDVRGLARSVNIELTHPFIRQRSENLSGSVKFNILDSTSNDNIDDHKHDKLRVLRMGGTYQTADRFSGSDAITGEISKGLGIFGGSRKGDANLTRLAGDPLFFKATVEASREQALSQRFSIFTAATGQKSANTLLASEEFGAGGASYGSAYDSSEITGEDGIAARLELRMIMLPPLPVDFLQAYGFYDVGKIWDRDTGVPRNRQIGLASAGLGLRSALTAHFSASFEAAKPLTRPVGTEGDNTPRYFGSLSARF